MDSLAKYRDVFGKPGEGVHKYRILGTPIVDVLASLLLAMFVTWLTKMPLELSIILVFVVGVIAHYIFGVQTNTTKFFS
jgi:hypothetical protein